MISNFLQAFMIQLQAKKKFMNKFKIEDSW